MELAQFCVRQFATVTLPEKMFGTKVCTTFFVQCSESRDCSTKEEASGVHRFWQLQVTVYPNLYLLCYIERPMFVLILYSDENVLSLKVSLRPISLLLIFIFICSTHWYFYYFIRSK